MDAQRTGLFLTELRKEHGWTKAELAQQLGVTDKAVSRWETGRGLPDTALLLPLAAALGVSVGELLAGERLDREQRIERTDGLLVDALRYSRRMSGWTVDIALLILAVFSQAFVGSHWLHAVVLAAIAVVRMILRARGVTLSPGALRILGAAALCAALVLELLPWGAVLCFAKGPNESFPPQYYSYFSLTPFGYANFTPLITGLLTAAALLLAVLTILWRKKGEAFRGKAFVCASLALLFTPVPLLLFGPEYMTWVSWLVFLFLLLSLFCLASTNGRGRG